MITLTTVGYGDFAPQTPAGKLFTMVYILVGLGILSSFIVLLAEHQRHGRAQFIERLTKRKKDEES